jgi:hypothetical protein
MRWWQGRKETAKRDADLERELHSDMELEEEEQRERGLSAEEARYAAQRAFGNTTLIREQTREAWIWSWMEHLVRDVTFGKRTLLHSPQFAFVSVLVMALGIGATTSLFTMVRAVLLRPLPFRDSGKLVMLYEHFREGQRAATDSMRLRQAIIATGAARPTALKTWRPCAATEASSPVCIPNCPRSSQSAGGSANLFPLLGVTPAFGRTFTEAEDQPSGEPGGPADLEPVPAPFCRRSFDCRQTDSSGHHSNHRHWRTAQLVYLSGCPDPILDALRTDFFRE